MGMFGKGALKSAQQFCIGIAKFAAFAQALPGHSVQSQATACGAQLKAFLDQPALQIAPVARIGEIIDEERP